MAKGRKSKAATPSESGSEEEYEVKDIIAHQRKKDKLEYYVSWVGYPDEQTWIPEADMENAPAIITKYWKTQAADKQHERFPKNSKQAKAAKEAAAEPRSSASKAKSKKRAAEESEEEQDDELELKDDSADESDDAPKSRRKSTSSAKGNGSVKKERKASPPPAKKAKKTYSAKKGGKKAKEPTPTPSVEEEAEVEVQEEDKKSEADIEELSGHGHPMSNNDAKHMNEKNWDELVSQVASIEQDDLGTLMLHVVWKEDDTASEITSELARQKCPQRVIDFYEQHLRFRQTVEEDNKEE